MKKVALLIALMTIIALTAFAGDIAVTVSGSSELTWGVNLNDPVATGFTNTNSGNIAFTLISATGEKGAEEAVYGYIKVGECSIKVATADTAQTLVWSVPAAEAKIIFPGGWVKISGANHGVNFIDNVQDPDGVNAVEFAALNGDPGLVLGITGAVPVEISVFSEDSYVANANSLHHYGAGIKTTLAFAPVTVDVAAEMGLNYVDTPMGAGGKLTLALSPLTIWAGADAIILPTMAYELGAGLSVAVMDGVALGASMSMDEVNGLDVKITASEASGDAGAVPVLGLSLTVGLYNLDTTLLWLIDVTADATFGPAKITATFGTGSDTINSLSITVDLSIITNVALSAGYASTDLATDNGTIKFGAKISL